MGGLIGQTTLTKNGLLPSRRASWNSQFTKGTLVVSFKTIYTLQPFFINTYHSGTFTCTLFNPSLFNNFNNCKALVLGPPRIKIYVKENEPNIYIKPDYDSNGTIAIQLIDSGNVDVVTTSNILDFNISGYKEIIPNSI